MSRRSAVQVAVLRAPAGGSGAVDPLQRLELENAALRRELARYQGVQPNEVPALRHSHSCNCSSAIAHLDDVVVSLRIGFCTRVNWGTCSRDFVSTRSGSGILVHHALTSCFYNYIMHSQNTRLPSASIVSRLLKKKHHFCMLREMLQGFSVGLGKRSCCRPHLPHLCSPCLRSVFGCQGGPLMLNEGMTE